MRDVDAATLVPGDVVVLEPGSAVPADARLLAATELRVIESALTGESLPVAKVADATLAADTVLADRATVVHKGTAVVAGRARARVGATGAATEVGRVGRLLASVEEERTPLERRLDALGRRLALVAVAVAALVAALHLAQGASLARVLETAIAVAIAAVPEGLPAVVTITMAVGVRRMARRHALVRRLPTVESLGAATVVCTDKTGTLTLGEMTVTALWLPSDRALEVHGTGYAPEGAIACDGEAVRASDVPGLPEALMVGLLANRADVVRGDDGRWTARGDPTEAALVTLAARAGLDRARLAAAWPEVGELPFSSERMLMATFHRASDGGLVALAKGAPRRVLDRCARVRTADGDAPLDVPLDDAARAAVLAANDAMAARGLRVLATAAGPARAVDEAALRDLTLLGLVGMTDPPAPGVPETVAALRAAGIRTVMLTGDQRLTAQAIAGALGVTAPGEATVDGREVDAMSPEALAARVAGIGAFSRVSPEAKLRIVDALEAQGAVVAMLGDGVNDAPALRRADVGVAMGRRGTDVAKEAAGVVLTDDRFPTIATAVEEGRVILANIRRFVFYLLSCNLGEILVLLGAGVAGLPAPLLPLQILWLNLVTDTFPALALAFEPADADVMRRPPRDPQAPLLSRRLLLASAGHAAVIAAVTLVALLHGRSNAPDDASAGTRAVTLSFMTLALTQVAHLSNARRLSRTRGPRPVNPYAVGAVVLTLTLQLLAMYLPPLARVLGVVPLAARDLFVVLALALVPAAVGLVTRALVR